MNNTDAAANTVTVQVGGNVRTFTYATGTEALAQANRWIEQALTFCPENDVVDVTFRGVLQRVARFTGGQAHRVWFGLSAGGYTVRP